MWGENSNLSVRGKKMKKDSKLNIDELWVEFQQHLSSLEKVNILIAGKSGVGKSTLINAAFRDNLAETGIGKPTTSRINLIEKEGVPVRIYDTVGFELDFRHLKKAQKDIHNLIKKTSKTPQLDDDIHCLWYCVSAPSARLEDEERSFIASIAKQGIPVILVLTKAGDKIEAEKLLNNIWIDISANLAAAVVLLAQRYGGTQPYGVDQLIEKTYQVIPERLHDSLVNAQKASIELKRKQAQSKLALFVATTFGEGFIPVPMSDSVMMIPTQIEMLREIAEVYGVDIEKHTLESVVPALLGVFGAFSSGKALFSYLKAIPGLNFAGGLISGGVGAAITTALGAVYIQLMELVVTGKVNLEATTSKELQDILVKLLKTYLATKMP